MSVFDTLAEQRYLEWEQKVSAPGYQPPEPARQTATRISYEGHIYREILLHLSKAAEAESLQTRAEMLEKVHQLEMQLTLLLERRCMPHALAQLRQSIEQQRQLVVERASKTPTSASTKPAS